MSREFSNNSFVSIKLVGFSDSGKEKFTTTFAAAESRLDIPWQIVNSEDADFYVLDSESRIQEDKYAWLQSISRKQYVFCTHTATDNNNEIIIDNDNIPFLYSLVSSLNHLTMEGFVSHTKSQISAVNHNNKNNNFSSYTFVSLKLLDFDETDKAKFESSLAAAESRLDAPWQIVDSEVADYYLVGSKSRLQGDQNTGLGSLPREQCIFCRYNTTSSNDNEVVLAKDNSPFLYSLLSVFNFLTTAETTSKTNSSYAIELQTTPANYKSESVYSEHRRSPNNDLDHKSRKTNDQKTNRKSVRYEFDPIGAKCEKKSLLGLNKALQLQIRNVSSRGALIELKIPMKLRGKITLIIQFDSQHTFVISARVVRSEGKAIYGLKFSNSQHEFIEYLVMDSGLPFSFL